MYFHSLHWLFINCRNEQFQEDLWSISCDLLKDWMSPEIKSKYYTPSQHTVAQSDKPAETEQPEYKPTEVKLTDDKPVDNE